MYGVSYGYHRPVVGFAIMMLFEAAAFFIAVIRINKMKETKEENELFDNAGPSLISKYNNILGNLSYIAFFAVISAVALSLPFLFFLSDYKYSVLTFESYFKFFSIITLDLVLVFFALKDIYCASIWTRKGTYININNIYS